MLHGRRNEALVMPAASGETPPFLLLHRAVPVCTCLSFSGGCVALVEHACHVCKHLAETAPSLAWLMLCIVYHVRPRCTVLKAHCCLPCAAASADLADAPVANGTSH